MTVTAKESATISFEAEAPESLYLSVRNYIDTHEDWDQSRVIQAALSLFLMQNGVNQPHVNSLYLDSLFGSTHE